jgi:glycosyltransferase involved in cell wall biosynthesis
LKLGLNLLHLVPGETGGAELYARRLISALAALEAPPQLTLFTGAEAAREGWPQGVEVVALRFDPRSRARRVAAEQALLPRAAGRSGIELLHNLFTTAPAVLGMPQVTTILDLIYRRFPETHAGLRAWGLRVLVPLAARRSRRILTLSESAKGDVIRFLGVPGERVDVTYLGPGIDDDVTPLPEHELRDRFDLGEAPVVLSVSAKRPHKNLERLFEAFARVEAEPTPLLLVTGYPTPFEAELRRRAGERVRFGGWVEDEALAGLYDLSTCLAFPSLAEGFGLPVLEAMRRGLPVACSDTTSLPEVAGEAALYFDPTDISSIGRAVERLLVDASTRERLAAAGRARAEQFSWEATARATLRSYELALNIRS